MAEIVATAFGIVTPLAAELYKSKIKSITEEVNVNDDLNLGTLIKWSESAVKELEMMIFDLEGAMDRNQSMITTHSFQSWRECVSNIMESVKTSIHALAKSKKQPIIIVWFQRYKKKQNLTQFLRYRRSLVDLLNGGFRFYENPNLFLVPPPPQQIIKIKKVPQIEGFPSLQYPLENTVRYLKHENVTCIAIYGTIGVGKTTVLHNLNNCQEVAHLFDLVIFLDGGTVRSDENMLQAIARRLKFTDSITSESVSGALRKYNKCLLLCDDVRRDLSTVIGDLDMPPGSKIVLTARSEFARNCQPMADIVIDLPSYLTDREAWEMFRKVVGEEVMNKPGIEKEARNVVKLCRGIPVLIKTIASSFVSNDRAEYWRAEVRRLTQQKKHKMKGVEEIYAYWKSCYNQLEADMANCFLYAALHPAASKICTMYLIESWAAEGLIDSGTEPMTRSEMLDEGQVVLKQLIDLAFLEKRKEKPKFVEMNSSIHEFAMHVQSERDGPDCRVVVKTSAAVSPVPQDWNEAGHRISMISNDVRELPKRTDCKNLLTLLLQRNLNLTCIPSSFFEHMKQLLLLDLYKTSIAELPSSVSNLVALKALYLNDCNQLNALPPEIKELKSLEVLDIRDTGIYYLPQVTWYLPNLKCFRTSFTGAHNQEKFDRNNVVSGPLVLEELAIYVKSYNNWHKEVRLGITLVVGMKKLTNLRFCFPDVSMVKEFVDAGSDVFNNLKSFQIYVGCRNKGCPEIIESLQPDTIYRYLKYCDGENGVTDEIKELVKGSEALEMIGHKDINNLSEMGTESLEFIYGCVIERCDKMVTLFGATKDIGAMLPHLQKLYLTSLKSLNSIAESKMVQNHWGLKVLELKDCPKLTKLFNQEVLLKLSKLEMLVVQNCGKVQELIPKQSRSRNRSTSTSTSRLQVLPKLQTLRLLNLPVLRSICADESITWPALQVLEINECPALEKLPFTTTEE